MSFKREKNNFKKSLTVAKLLLENNALRAELEERQLSLEHWNRRFDLQTQKCDTLRAQLAIAKEALKVYSETHVWCLATMKVKEGNARGLQLWEDLGIAARKALAKIEEGKTK